MLLIPRFRFKLRVGNKACGILKTDSLTDLYECFRKQYSSVRFFFPTNNVIKGEEILTLINAVLIFRLNKSAFMGKENQKPQSKADNNLCMSVNNDIKVIPVYRVPQSRARLPLVP